MGASALLCPASIGIAKDVEHSSHAFDIAMALHRHADAPVPDEVAKRISWTLLDGFAVMHFGARARGSAPFLSTMSCKLVSQHASVPALSLQLAPEDAAAINAFLIHAAEVDDSDLRGQLRASAVVLPAVLAAAEIADASGQEFVRALALGYTLQGRFTAPLSAPVQSRGWMASGVWGPPAAAAAAALLMKLPPSQIASAIGLAGSGSGGLFQYFYDQTEEKRLIVARAARTAIESVQLAQAGEIGPTRIIEGRAGLYALFAGQAAPSASVLTANLEAMEGPLFIYPKLFAASHSIIPSLDGMAADLPASFKWQEVASYVVRGDQGWADTVGSKMLDYSATQSPIGAMLNYPFVIAMFLIRRSVMPSDYPSAMEDPRVDAFARLGTFEVQKGPADLSIEFRMKDGSQQLVRARTPGPEDRAPLNTIGRQRKIAALTADLTILERRRLEELCHSVSEAKSMRAWVGEVTTVLRAGPQNIETLNSLQPHLPVSSATCRHRS